MTLKTKSVKPEDQKDTNVWEPLPLSPIILQAARDLRKHMTSTETLLWHCLRSKQLGGYKFRRQHPIGNFIVDFYCAAANLAIELDGGHHNDESEKVKDTERTEWLNQRGVRVLRFWNSEVLNNLPGVLDLIWECLQEDPHPNPPPLGEGAGGIDW